MKAKVLRYRFDGNAIIAPYMDLEPYAENVFISLVKKNESGNESADCFYVVCKISNVYFTCGEYPRYILDKERAREEAETYCRNWIAKTLKNAESGNCVTQLDIRVFEELGLDPVPLMQAREAYTKKLEQKRLEMKMEEEEKRRQKETEWQQLLDDNKRKFLAGEKNTAEMFLEITKRDGFDIHIRTKGTFNRSVITIDKETNMNFRLYKGRRIPDFTGCDKAVRNYLAFLSGK